MRENFRLLSATCPLPPLSLSFLWFFSVKMAEVKRGKTPKEFASACLEARVVLDGAGHGLVHYDVC